MPENSRDPKSRLCSLRMERKCCLKTTKMSWNLPFFHLLIVDIPFGSKEKNRTLISNGTLLNHFLNCSSQALVSKSSSLVTFLWYFNICRTISVLEVTCFHLGKDQRTLIRSPLDYHALINGHCKEGLVRGDQAWWGILTHPLNWKAPSKYTSEKMKDLHHSFSKPNILLGIH